jgi:hypothetical protein
MEKKIKTGARQGCSLSLLLLIIYINKMIQKWRLIRHGNIPIGWNFNIDTIHFADDQIFMAKYEDDLYNIQYSLNNIFEEFSMEINTGERKIMAF